ncbi:MAG: FecR domain-containing protein [Rikenellaceae bacterium]
MDHSKYSKYSVEELLKDEAFIMWQINPTYAQNIFWDKVICGDKQLAMRVKQAAAILKQSKMNDSCKLSSKQKSELFSKINKKARSQKRRVTLYEFLSIAASIIGIFILATVATMRVNNAADQDELLGALNQHGSMLDTIQNIQLIIGDQRAINIEDNEDIDYTEKGLINIQNGDRVKNFAASVNSQEYNSLLVPHGRRTQIALADGSKVWVNSGTKLCFSPDMSGAERHIYVDGEIYIEVAHDKSRPFYVHTDNISVKVYGTKFGVSSIDSERVSESVVLVEGSVSVARVANSGKNSKASEEVFITPNQRYTLSGHNIEEVEEVSVDKYISWHDGVWILDHTTYAEVATKLRRYYGVEISLQNDLADLTCSGKLVLNNHIDTTLDVLCKLFGSSYKISETSSNKLFVKITQ